MRSAFLSGVSVVLWFCASGIFRDIKKIYYIEVNDISSPKDQDEYDREYALAKMIACFFNYNILRCGRYNFDYLSEDRSSFDSIDDLPINENDILSANVSMFKHKKLSIKPSIEIFPEGATIINQLNRIGGFKRYYRFKQGVKKILSYCNLRSVIDARKYYVLPDYLGITGRLVKDLPIYQVLPIDRLLENFQKIFSYLDSAYGISKVLGDSPVYIHPVSAVYPMDDYGAWLRSIEESAAGKVIFLKKHPTDTRAFPAALLDRHLKLLPDALSSIPLELLFCKPNISYIGYISTTLLFLEPARVKIVEPPRKDIMFTKMFYPGLNDLFCPVWKKYWL